MAKFSKDEVQKIVLSCLLFAGLIYCYFQFLLGPINSRKSADEAEIEKLAVSTREGRGTVNKLRSLQAQADQAGEILIQIESLIPEGAPVAWFPPRISSFFEQHGIGELLITKASEDRFDVPALEKFRKITWVVEMPKAKFVNFAIALAGFENQFPLVRVSMFDVTEIEDDPIHQTIKLTLVSVFKP